MTALRRPRSRPRPRSTPGALCVWLLLALAAGPLAAQEPPPRDTTAAPRDTAAVPPDTLAADTAAADTLPPPEVFPELPEPVPASWSAGVWVWDRADLLASAALTVTDLLNRVPGITTVRSGLFGLPEAAAAFGAAGGRVEVLLDGYALDPLAAGTLDLSTIELVALREVRIERRLGGLRIELHTVRPTERRPYSIVEAGDGYLGTNLFRGLFQSPDALGGQLGLAFERLNTDGFRGVEPAAVTTGWAKWGIVSGGRGAQLELRRSSIDREGRSPFVGESERTDLLVRARGLFFGRLGAEAFVGRTSVQEPSAAPVSGEPADSVGLEVQGTQLGLHTMYESPRFWGGSSLRYRSQDGLPQVDATLRGGVRLAGMLGLEGSFRWADWRGASAAEYAARASVAPLGGLELFGEVVGGERGVPQLRTAGGQPLRTERSAGRVGLAFARWGLRAGVAAVRLDSTDVAAFGLPFDRTTSLFPAGSTTGVEASAYLPIFDLPLAVEGWYTGWDQVRGWIYLPTRSWGAALVYRQLPLESGNLELTGRLAGRYRGPMLVPQLDDGDAAATASVPELLALDLDFVLRILDVRVFLRWENLLNRRSQFDLPGRVFPGPLVVYGVKWEFRN